MMIMIPITNLSNSGDPPFEDFDDDDDDDDDDDTNVIFRFSLSNEEVIPSI